MVKKIAASIITIFIGMVVILAVPTKYEGPMLLYINEQHSIHLLDAIGLVLVVLGWSYLSLSSLKWWRK